MRAAAVILAALSSAVAGGHAGASAQSSAREPIVGQPCEGCEAVFEGRPGSLSSTARIAPAGEPGQALVVSGRVLDRAGRPRAGVVVYAYHTNDGGLYPPPPTSVGAAGNRHGRLRGWAVSDSDGRYTFETIRPGAYPTRDAPAHIHMHVIESGCATYYIDDVMFTDDPLLTPDARIRFSNGRAGSGIATPVRGGGAWHVTRDIALGRGVPGYPACGLGTR